MKKILILVLVFILGLFASNWIFNHINPWLGWVSYLLTIGLTINYIVKAIKRSEYIDTDKKDKN